MQPVAASMPGTSRQLYKYLLREIQKLPKETRSYYRHNVKQQFISHNDETDPERVRQIICKAYEDAAWVIRKYKDPTNLGKVQG